MNELPAIEDATATLINSGVLGAVLVIALAGIVWLIHFILTKQMKAVAALGRQVTSAVTQLKNIADNTAEIKADLARYQERTDQRLIEHGEKIAKIGG